MEPTTNEKDGLIARVWKLDEGYVLEMPHKKVATPTAATLAVKLKKELGDLEQAALNQEQVGVILRHLMERTVPIVPPDPTLREPTRVEARVVEPTNVEIPGVGLSLDEIHQNLYRLTEAHTRGRLDYDTLLVHLGEYCPGIGFDEVQTYLDQAGDRLRDELSQMMDEAA